MLSTSRSTTLLEVSFSAIVRMTELFKHYINATAQIFRMNDGFNMFDYLARMFYEVDAFAWNNLVHNFSK